MNLPANSKAVFLNSIIIAPITVIIPDIIKEFFEPTFFLILIATIMLNNAPKELKEPSRAILIRLYEQSYHSNYSATKSVIVPVTAYE